MSLLGRIFEHVHLLNGWWRLIWSNGGYCASWIFHTNIQDIYKCRIVGNTIEYVLEKSVKIWKILGWPVISSPTYFADNLVAFLSSKAWICVLNCQKFWIGSPLASLSSRPFHLTRGSYVGGWLECRTMRSTKTSSTSWSCWNLMTMGTRWDMLPTWIHFISMTRLE